MDGAGPQVVDGAAERLLQVVERLRAEHRQAEDGAERLRAVTVPLQVAAVTVPLRVAAVTVLPRAERRRVVVLERLRAVDSAARQAEGSCLLRAERWRRAAVAV